MFGAKIGVNVLVRPTVVITYPWKVQIGDGSWIGDHVVLYSLGNIEIGSNSVISQRTYVCAGDHDFLEPSFPIRSRPITIADEVWVATDCFVAPGVSIGRGVVVGARSSVFKSISRPGIYMGSPAKFVKDRNAHKP
jgi:putative colanic acid biosynthesis acetyltransferase WcaF